MTIQIKQQAMPKGKDWWEWSIWLEGPSVELNAIDQVFYTLHPTFHNPVVSTRDRQSGFRLDSSGWGEFVIHLRITKRDGSEVKRKHNLKLNQETGKVKSKTTNSTPLTVFVSGGMRDLDAVHAVREALLTQGVKAIGPEDVTPGESWQRTMDNTIATADACIFVISGRPTLWQTAEIKAAVKSKARHIVPVMLGEGVEVPEMLRDKQVVRVKNVSAVGEVTEAILKTSLWKR